MGRALHAAPKALTKRRHTHMYDTIMGCIFLGLAVIACAQGMVIACDGFMGPVR